MTDAPVTHAAKVKLSAVVLSTWSKEIVDEVLADMRTLERELNALRQRERERESDNRIEG